MEEAEQLCGRVAIMDHGRILALDTPAALRSGLDADTVVTVTARGDLEALEKALRATLPDVTGARLVDGGVELHMRGADRLFARVLAATEQGGFDIVDLAVAEPTLENVFISLTGRELRD
jgi:ABC-2 type transport system ATP-binding protein